MIGAQQHILITAVLLVLVAAGVAIERTRAGRLLPAPAVVLIATILLANIGVLPHKAAAYEQLARVAVPVGVFLLLLRADIRRIFRETGVLLRLYLIGAAASVLGTRSGLRRRGLAASPPTGRDNLGLFQRNRRSRDLWFPR